MRGCSDRHSVALRQVFGAHKSGDSLFGRLPEIRGIKQKAQCRLDRSRTHLGTADVPEALLAMDGGELDPVAVAATQFRGREVDETHGFLGSPAARPRDASDRNRYLRTRKFQCAGRHGHGHLRRNSAVCFDKRLLDPKHLRLGLVRIGHETALEHIR